jgi:hypothetical protein
MADKLGRQYYAFMPSGYQTWRHFYLARNFMGLT